jgi:hypothetical protein
MSIVVASKITQPNQTITFEFPGHQVLNYVVGLAYWKFSFGSKDHHVRTCALNLASNKDEPGKVSVKVTGTLSDDSGNNISNTDSQVTVCIVAVLDSPDSQIALGAANAIPNNGASTALPVPSSNLAISSAVLSGWELGFSGDHHVRHFLTTAGLSVNGNSAQITAQAQMSDDSGNSATTASINGGMIAATPAESGLMTVSKTNIQDSATVTAEFPKDVLDAVVLVQSVDMQFKGDHHVRSLGGGSTGWVVEGKQVKLDNARAFMYDTSGNNEVTGSSSVNLVVVGTPK